MSGIHTAEGPFGEILHVVPYLPSDLPPVSRFHLERAWEEAHAAAFSPIASPPHGFRFLCPPAPPLDLLLTDPDAAQWIAGIERIASLSTAYGISLCLRLLALVQLMGIAPWLRRYFRLEHGAAFLSFELLSAAADAPLTPQGSFAETTLRALLPEDFDPRGNPEWPDPAT